MIDCLIFGGVQGLPCPLFQKTTSDWSGGYSRVFFWAHLAHLFCTHHFPGETQANRVPIPQSMCVPSHIYSAQSRISVHSRNLILHTAVPARNETVCSNSVACTAKLKIFCVSICMRRTCSPYPMSVSKAPLELRRNVLPGMAPISQSGAIYTPERAATATNSALLLR